MHTADPSERNGPVDEMFSFPAKLARILPLRHVVFVSVLTLFGKLAVLCHQRSNEIRRHHFRWANTSPGEFGDPDTRSFNGLQDSARQRNRSAILRVEVFPFQANDRRVGIHGLVT